jgi:hypothetical protein
MPRCHQRASPMECRSPGNPTCPGNETESCFAVHSGSAGTSCWNRNQSRPGVLCRVQYRRGWSVMIWTPDRMMKISRNRLTKCCQPTQAGIPRCRLGGATDPGYWSMNVATAGKARNSLASAMPAINTTKPIGSSHSRLNHRDRPRRTRGAIPDTAGTDPTHVATSMASSPRVSSGRPCSAAGGRWDGPACPTPTGGSSVTSPRWG